MLGFNEDGSDSVGDSESSIEVLASKHVHSRRFDIDSFTPKEGIVKLPYVEEKWSKKNEYYRLRAVIPGVTQYDTSVVRSRSEVIIVIGTSMKNAFRKIEASDTDAVKFFILFDFSLFCACL